MPPLLADDQGESEWPHQRIGRSDLAALFGLVALLSFLWGRARGVFYWVDEGISIGISSHAFTSIPDLLRQDGSPPLYYLLLNVWMSLFGSSEAATHLLSLGFALATVPAALWTGWSLFGRQVGWIFCALMALNPFVAYYANETRMYTLLVLLGMLATATFVHAFVFRRRRYLFAFTLTLTLLIYTHNWGLFFGIGAGVSALLCALLARDRRAVLVDAVLGFGAAAILYLPWVPILLDQIAHTGAQFALRPALEVVRADVVGLLGLTEAAAVLGVGAAFGLATLLQRPWKRTGLTVVVIAVVPGVTLTLGWLISRQDSVWVQRYLAVVVAPIALVVALGIARGGRLAISCLAIYAILVAPIAVKRLPTQKSDVKVVLDHFRPQLRSGDLVVTDFGRVPVLAYYLPPGLRYAEAPGQVADARVSDQRNGTERLRAADPSVTLPPLVRTLPVGGHVLVVCRPTTLLPKDATEYTELIVRRCNQAKDLLAADPEMRLAGEIETDTVQLETRDHVYGALFEKVS